MNEVQALYVEIALHYCWNPKSTTFMLELCCDLLVREIVENRSQRKDLIVACWRKNEAISLI